MNKKRKLAGTETKSRGAKSHSWSYTRVRSHEFLQLWFSRTDQIQKPRESRLHEVRLCDGSFSF